MNRAGPVSIHGPATHGDGPATHCGAAVMHRAGSATSVYAGATEARTASTAR